jgi:hypothetical protein
MKAQFKDMQNILISDGLEAAIYYLSAHTIRTDEFKLYKSNQEILLDYVRTLRSN